MTGVATTEPGEPLVPPSASGTRPTLQGLDLASALLTVFQPLIDLDSGNVVGYEALTRGPRERGLLAPDDLFAAARREGRLTELDWACRWSAVEAARRAGLRHPLSLFINAEPEALAGPPGAGIERWQEMSDLRCFAEITERALMDSPAELLRLADAVRSQDWGIALDDIGANPQTVALMPMLQPDVLKLDLRVLRDHDSVELARSTHAVLAQAQETGACVVAEGIEDERQRDLAVALGVRIGQGWLFGRPGPLPDELPQPVMPIGLLPRLHDRAVAPSPYAVVNDSARARVTSRATLQLVWRQIEQQVLNLDPAPVVLLAFPDQESTDAALDRYAELSRRLPLVAATLGPRVRVDAPGLRVQQLDRLDPAAEDWNLIVLSPQYAVALVARPRLGTAPGSDTPWEFVLTFARPLVVRAANAMLMRLQRGA